MTPLTELLDTAVAATDLASDLIRNRPPGTLTPKGDRDYASEVDYAVERELRSFLAAQTPGIGFLGEEEGASGDPAGPVWALDPVDGTVNFARSLPLCAVSLALVVDKRPVLGVIDLPFLGSRYTAVQGHGARRDGQPIRVSDVGQLQDAIVSIGDYAVGESADRKNGPRLSITSRLAGSALRVRMFGSAAIDLAWLAEGKTDGVVMLSNKPWDTAAGVILAREAGALVVDIDGSDHTTDAAATVAAAPELFDALLALIRPSLDCVSA